MTIGVALSLDPAAANSVTDLIERAGRAHRAGLESAWLNQLPTNEALSVAPLISTAVPGLRVGTSVVTMNPRHPLVVGTQARVAAAVGEFTLGIGLGAPGLEQRTYDIDDQRRIGRLREFLAVLGAVRDGGPVDHRGRLYTASAEEQLITGGGSFGLLVAALGPKALEVTGRLADGTLTYLAGPRALREFIVPRLRQAAAEAGRPTPRVVAAVPAVVTDDPARVRADANASMGFYDQIRSYRVTLEREGVERASELALIGDESTVQAGLQQYRDAGADELILTQTALGTPEEEVRTWEVAASGR